MNHIEKVNFAWLKGIIKQIVYLYPGMYTSEGGNVHPVVQKSKINSR